MSTGTNFSKGLAVREKYSGNADSLPNDYELAANTKLVRKMAVIHCVGSDADNTEQTTDFSLPAGCIVQDILVNVLTVDSGETVSIGTEGTSNDPDGFAVGVSLTNAGIVRPGATITTGSNEVFVGGSTRGALLASALAGSDATTDTGHYVEKPYYLATKDPVSFTCSDGTDTAVFDIILVYDQVVSEA